jgi:hypothetical protein
LKIHPEAHQRHVDPVDMPHAIAEATADLTTLVEQAQFLADWPLVYVDSTRWDQTSAPDRSSAP